MSALTNHSATARTALGKFYLHPWDSQVLVDWASATVQQGVDEEELTYLSEMEGADRMSILEQFRTVVLVSDLRVDFDETAAIKAYIENLRDRVAADEIDPRAAFAQVRPLAYDLEGIQLTGLGELDEDLNLLDSGQPAFHHADMTADKVDFYLRTFFRNAEVLAPLPAPEFSPLHDPTEVYPDDYLDEEAMQTLENIALVVVITLVVLYIYLVIAGFQ